MQLAFLDQKEYEGASADVRQCLLRRDVGDPVSHVQASLRTFDPDLASVLLQKITIDDVIIRGAQGKDKKTKKVASGEGLDDPRDKLLGLPRMVFDDSMLNLRLRDADVRAEAAFVAVDASVGGASAKWRTVQNVDCLCELYPSEPPLQKARHTMEFKRHKVVFYPGKFLDRLRPEWLSQRVRCSLKTPGVQLPPKSKAKIESLPWFGAWRRNLRTRSCVKERVREKVRLLCHLWAGREAPKTGQPKRRPSRFWVRISKLDGGKFLAAIRNNWFARHPITQLHREDMQRLELLPWFNVLKWGTASWH